MTDQQPLSTEPAEPKQGFGQRMIQHGPLLYAVLVFVGFIHQHAFHRQFGIDVWTYLSTSELLLSFMPLSLGIMAAIALVVSGMSLPYVVPNRRKRERHEQGGVKKRPRAHRQWKQTRAWARLKICVRKGWGGRAIGHLLQLALYLGLFVCLFGGIGLMGIILNGTQIRWLGSDRIVALVFIWLVSFFTLLFNSTNGDFRDPGNKWIIWAALVFVGTATAYQVSVNRALKVLDQPTNVTATITTNTETITTDSLLVYVGKLQGVVFLYDKRSGVGSAIPMSTVERIDLKTLQMATFQINDPREVLDTMTFRSVLRDFLR